MLLYYQLTESLYEWSILNSNSMQFDLIQFSAMECKANVVHHRTRHNKNDGFLSNRINKREEAGKAVNRLFDFSYSATN